MTTYNKNFVVKNGLDVTNDATVGGSVTVGSVTNNDHAATKSYVDTNMLVTVSSSTPSSPANGKMWYDTGEERLKIYTGSAWTTIATLADAEYLQDHIHDTAIDGDGLIEQVIG